MKDTADPFRPACVRGAVAQHAKSSLRSLILSGLPIAAALALCSLLPNLAAAQTEAAAACSTYGQWIDVKTGRPLVREDLFRDLIAKSSVVLLGESHTD